MIKILVLHPTPKDPEHFKKHYRNVHMPIAAKMPGMVSCKYTYDIKPFQTAYCPPIFCIFEIEFPDRATMEKAYQSDVGKQVMADVPNFATGGPPQVMVYELTDAHPAT